jgi:hypothetical protein
MDMASRPNNKVSSPQDPAPASDALITIEASLKAETDVGEVISSLETIDQPSSGDGEQAQFSSRNHSNRCDSNADDHLGFEVVSDTMPSEVSRANLTEGSGKSFKMIPSSHTTNTAANVRDGLQPKHTRNASTTLSEIPWGAESPWGIYKLPEEFDEQGRMTRWTEVIVQKVKPYIEEGRYGQKGGSGILDTDDTTHYYIMMPLGSLDLPPEVPEEIEEQRRMYSEATHIEPLGSEEHTGLTDIESSESSDDSSNEDNTDSTQENDLNTSNSTATIVPAGPTFGGLWNPIGTRDVRESRYSPEVNYTQICLDDTGSVFSWTSDECDPEDAGTQAPNVSRKSGDKRDPEVEDVQVHKFAPKSDEECDAEFEDLRAHGFFRNFKDERETEIEDMQAQSVRNRILITTTDGGTVRIDLPKVIAISYSGKPTKELPFSIANLSKACWDVIKDHGIASVRAINANKSTDVEQSPWTVARQFRSGLCFDTTTSSLPVFNSVWIQTNATFAMKQDFPFIEYYLDIQATCDRNLHALAPEHISFLYYDLNDLSAHYLLNKPLAPHNSTLEEQMADGTMVSVDESNLTVPQFIKRLYIDAKLKQEQLRRLSASYLGPSVVMLPLPGPSIGEAAAMVDDWAVAERVLVPTNFDHNTTYFDLQQINWVDNVGLRPHRVRQERDSRYVEYRNTDNEITHASRTQLPCFVFTMLTTGTAEGSIAKGDLQPRSLRPEGHVHEVQSQHAT